MPPPDDDRELLTIGERQRVADVVEVLGYDEDVSGPPGPQRCVEAEGLLEPYGPSDFTKHDLPPRPGVAPMEERKRRAMLE